MMSSHRVLMVEPNYFVFNASAAQDNVYMSVPTESDKEIQQKAMSEFNLLVSTLEDSGIEVHKFRSIEGCVDAVWPNNWIATLPNRKGEVQYSLYPMKSENRRIERKNKPIIEFLETMYPLGLSKDWSIGYEERNQILEGTGSLVIDHQFRKAYIVASDRTDINLARDWASFYDYEPIIFHANHKGKAVYHTNVVMAMGHNFVLVAIDLVPFEEQKMLLTSFSNTGKQVIRLTTSQVSEFCGNALELRAKEKYILVMSSRAFTAYTEAQKVALTSCGIHQIIHSSIPTLENIGGGSCRCMLAELL